MKPQVNLHYGDLVDSSNLASIMAKAHGHLGLRIKGLWLRGLACECPVQGYSALILAYFARCFSSGLNLLDLVIFPFMSLHPDIFQ